MLSQCGRKACLLLSVWWMTGAGAFADGFDGNDPYNAELNFVLLDFPTPAITLAGPNPGNVRYWIESLAVAGENGSFATSIRDDGLVAGYRIMPNNSASGGLMSWLKQGFVRGYASPYACNTATSSCSPLAYFVGLRSDLVADGQAAVAMTGDTTAPLLLVEPLDGQQAHGCDPFVPDVPTTSGALLLAQWNCNSAPNINNGPERVLSWAPQDRVFSNRVSWFAVTPVSGGAVVVDARAGSNAMATIPLPGIARVYGINDQNQVIGVTAEDGSGDPKLLSIAAADYSIAAVTLPKSWHVNLVSGGTWAKSFATVWPVAINKYQVILRVGSYEAAPATCTGTACNTTVPDNLFARTNDLFYCLLREQCAWAYAMGVSPGTAYEAVASSNGPDLDDMSVLLSGSALPAVQASAPHGYFFGDDGMLVGHHLRGGIEEPFLFSVRKKTNPVVFLADVVQTPGWSGLRVTGRTPMGTLSGYASSAIGRSAVVFGVEEYLPSPATGSTGDANSGGGATGPWSLLIFLLMAGLRRRRAGVRQLLRGLLGSLKR